MPYLDLTTSAIPRDGFVLRQVAAGHPMLLVRMG